MTDDPIMAEVRATRDRLAARFDYDVEAIFRHIQAREARSGLTYVAYPPRRPVSADGVQDSERHGQPPSRSSTASATVRKGPAGDENAGTRDAARQEPGLRKRQAAEATQVMRELQGRLNVGRRLTREERNER